MEIIKTEVSKKRGRKSKNQIKEYRLNQVQTKFFIDLTNDKEVLIWFLDYWANAIKRTSGANFNYGKTKKKSYTELKEDTVDFNH